MHRSARHRHAPDTDLAALVLAEPRRRAAVPEQQHVDRGRRSSNAATSFEPRSLLVLALVVATMAMVVAWTAGVVRGDGTAPPRPTQLRDGSTAEGGAAAIGSRTHEPATAADTRPDGIDLVPGLITTSASASGGVVVRVAVSNEGLTPLGSGADAEVALLVDGELVGSEPVDDLDAGGASAVVSFPLDSCAAGRHALAAFVDLTARVREADELDNATTRAVTFRC